MPFLVPSQLNSGGYFFQAIARLRPGVSLKQAREAMNVIADGYSTALGATPASVMRMVLAHGRRLTLLGVVLGIAGALVVSRLMQQMLFEVNPAEPVVYVALSLILLLVAECAAWLPAQRATRIHPLIALRTE